jgi:hypothetical protein
MKSLVAEIDWTAPKDVRHGADLQFTYQPDTRGSTGPAPGPHAPADNPKAPLVFNHEQVRPIRVAETALDRRPPVQIRNNHTDPIPEWQKAGRDYGGHPHKR